MLAWRHLSEKWSWIHDDVLLRNVLYVFVNFHYKLAPFCAESTSGFSYGATEPKSNKSLLKTYRNNQTKNQHPVICQNREHQLCSPCHKKENFVSFPGANPYLRNASRTNKTSSSGIVREAQREANTDMKKSQKRPRCDDDPEREGRERGA